MWSRASIGKMWEPNCTATAMLFGSRFVSTGGRRSLLQQRPPSNVAQYYCAASSGVRQLCSCNPVALRAHRTTQHIAELSDTVARQPQTVSRHHQTAVMIADVDSRCCFEPRACLERGVRLLVATSPRDVTRCPVGADIASAAMAHSNDEAVISMVNGSMESARVTGKLVGAWEQIQSSLLANGWAYYQSANPEFVAPHPQNRSGDGVNPDKAHKLGQKIVALGYSAKRASDATCFEAPTDPSRSAAFFKSANDIAALSSGLCPHWQALPKFYSVGGSNTNMFFRALAKGVRTSVQQLQDERGRINKDRLLSDPVLKDVVEGSGMKWLVLSERCEREFPSLPEFIQNALNAEAKEPQTEVEIIRWGWRTTADI